MITDAELEKAFDSFTNDAEPSAAEVGEPMRNANLPVFCRRLRANSTPPPIQGWSKFTDCKDEHTTLSVWRKAEEGTRYATALLMSPLSTSDDHSWR